ncbi:hypothetical protein M422DRAFT_38769, partial [Sphaerobolus stellatus SS14]
MALHSTISNEIAGNSWISSAVPYRLFAPQYVPQYSQYGFRVSHGEQRRLMFH